MLKLNIGWSEERLAQQIAFGLSEGNLEKLPHAPIFFKGSEVEVEVTGFLIFYTHKDESLFKQDFENVLHGIGLIPDTEQPVMNIDNALYVAPLSIDEEVPPIYAIGLHAISYQKLRNGERLNFRVRMIDGEGQNVEVNIFSGETEEAMAKSLKLTEEFNVSKPS